MSPTPFTIEELPAGTRVYVKGEGYGVVLGLELEWEKRRTVARDGDVFHVVMDDGEALRVSRLDITSKVVDLEEEDRRIS